ncbi:MAG: site-2 protease family protein [Cyanobacteriota bacterium]
MGDGGWQLLSIRGIPLRIHPSWFVVLLLATIAFQQGYARPSFGLSESGQWLYALLTALLLFVSVLLHELGHSLVAMHQGVQVRSITLFLLGGVASVERECSTPEGAFLVAAAGPAVSLALCAALIALQVSAIPLPPPLEALVGTLGLINGMLALFNLLPGLPLDGGLILKALVWKVTGSQRRGIEMANASGRFLALVALAFGGLRLFQGGAEGLWWILLGWFGLGASRNQRQLLRLQEVLLEGRVRQAARRRFRVVEGDLSLRELSRLKLEEAGDGGDSLPDWWLVCERGRWRGVLHKDPLQDLPIQRWDQERVRDHLAPLNSLPTNRQDAPLWQAALLLDQPDVSRLLVLSPAGLPVGTLERPELGAVGFEGLGLKVPAPLLDLARRQGTYPMGLALAQVARSMQDSGQIRDPAVPLGSSPSQQR